MADSHQFMGVAVAFMCVGYVLSSDMTWDIYVIVIYNGGGLRTTWILEFILCNEERL